MSLPSPRIRWRFDVGFELRCDQCSTREHESYWPLTVEFWKPEWGMTRCRACWQQRDRAIHRSGECRRRDAERKRVARRLARATYSAQFYESGRTAPTMRP